MSEFDGWEKIEPPLGKGGQGIVYKARSPERARKIRDYSEQIRGGLRKLNGIGPYPPVEELVKLMVDVGGPDDIKDLGALKVFEIHTGSPEGDKAYGRLQSEINALKSINHSAVLKLLHSNGHKSFIVTEFHPLGTLNAHLNRYAGCALEALLAFKPVVQGVALIHQQGAIHRDIKTENIFLATDGRLVLGDFGIVFFADEQRTRLTDVYGERVGSHFWMAPWAYEPVRLPIDEIKPTLDIFPLGKVLWSMIAGRNGPLYWEYDRPENNLVKLFPDDPAMPIVNYILSKCIVRDEADCAQDATILESLVAEAIRRIRNLDRRSDGDLSWRCLVCKQGYYGKEWLHWTGQGLVDPQRGVSADVGAYAYICDHCGHIQFFKK